MKNAFFLTFVVLLVTATAGPTTTAEGQIIYVDADSTGANDGSSWVDAYRYLQDALATAQGGDGIRVAQGTYKPDQGDGITPGNRTATFELRNGVAIRGGYAGFGEPNPYGHNVHLYETILSGDLNGNDIDVNDPCDLPTEFSRQDNSYHVVVGGGTNKTAVLDGFTIIAGNSNSSYPHDRGAGMYNHSSNSTSKPTVNNCTFKDNSATNGGAMYNFGVGGSQNAYGPGPTLTNCVFSRNWAYIGGALHNRRSSVTSTNCTFTQNSAELIGGAISQSNGPLILTNCTFFENSSHIAGAIDGKANGTKLTACVFNSNSATLRGGGIYTGSSTFIANCKFTENTAAEDGGAIYNLGESGKLSVTNCTFSGNSAGRKGGGLYNNWLGRLNLTNCILWGNIDRSGINQSAQIYDEVPTTINYSCIQGWTGSIGGEGNVGDEPHFTHDLHLQADSPCIDSGDLNYSPTPGETDIDGEQRVYGHGLDMGCDEFVDIDIDGLPDWWELKYFSSATVAKPEDDPDVDEWVNIAEYIHGYDPLNPLDPKIKYFVDLVYGNDNWDGLAPTWDGQHGPKATIQSAIDDCYDGSAVIVALGTYTGDGNRDIDFKGKAITVRCTNPDDPNVVALTIIDCNGTKESPHRGFYFHNEEDANSILSGFTITNGFAPYEQSYSHIEDRAVGGSIYCIRSNPTISKCVITFNEATYGGGGICLHNNSNPTIIDCVISDNKVQYDYYNWGGGIYCSQSNPLITNCTICNNGCVATYARGGGIGCNESNPTINNCTISENSSGGGLSCDDDSNPTLVNCIISNNQDGGIYINEGELINCIISDNEKWGVNNRGCNITNCTIVNNAQGISCSYYESTITNCIIWNNLSQQISDDYGIVSISYSNVQGGWKGEGNIDADPRFTDPTTGDYHLLVDSPCADAGDEEYITPWETDIDGEPRVANVYVDMGADEISYTEGPLITISPRRFRLFAREGSSNPTEQILSIRNNGTGILHWELTHSSFWLEAEPCCGSSTGEIDTVVLNINTSELTRGRYSCELMISDPNSANISRVAIVALHVTNVLNVPSDYTTIQETIDAAIDGDLVVIAEGTYSENINFKGKEITLRSKDPNNQNIIAATIIDGGQNGSVVTFNNREGTNSVLNGLTITNGGYDYICGGGINCTKSSPTIKNCYISGNTSYGYCPLPGPIAGEGGGIYCYQSNPTISNCTIADNLADYDGGGICCQSSNPAVINCTIANNNSGTMGGGLYCDYSSPIIRDCTISNNNTGLDGGGIFCYYWSSCKPTISNSVISSNRSGWRGGGIYAKDITLTNCRIIGNYTVHYGGGIYSSTAVVTNCTICGNSARNAGGLFCRSGDCLMISNCIFWANGTLNQPQIHLRDCSNVWVSYSNIRDGWEGIGNIDADPCFVDPGYWADANDPNISVEPNDPNATWINGDYHLKSEGWSWDTQRQVWTWDDVTSPCIDAGNPGSPLGDEPLSVPPDPNNEWGENLRINMGAYGGTIEASMPPHGWALLADTTNDGTVNLQDYALQATDWLNSAECQPGDLNRNDMVDPADLALFADDWLKQTSWY